VSRSTRPHPCPSTWSFRSAASRWRPTHRYSAARGSAAAPPWACARRWAKCSPCSTGCARPGIGVSCTPPTTWSCGWMTHRWCPSPCASVPLRGPIGTGGPSAMATATPPARRCWPWICATWPSTSRCAPAPSPPRRLTPTCATPASTMPRPRLPSRDHGGYPTGCAPTGRARCPEAGPRWPSRPTATAAPGSRFEPPRPGPGAGCSGTWDHWCARLRCPVRELPTSPRVAGRSHCMAPAWTSR
jgi:hypothetical protein